MRRLLARAAFTRVELLVLLAVLTLLAVVVFPSLANSRSRSQRVLCANNLRQIGNAFQLWSGEHGDLYPFEVAFTNRGTQLHPLAPNPWLHFAAISNELADPRVLLCPSDTGQAARDFSGDPSGGYIHPNFANRATSYLLSHTAEHLPSAMLSADRNVGSDGSTTCASFVTSRLWSFFNSPQNVRWTNGLHGAEGNLLSFDGRVQQLTSADLRAAAPFSSTLQTHFIVPR